MSISTYEKKKEKKIKNKLIFDKKNNINSILLRNLLKSRAHHGHLLKKTSPEIYPFLYGTRSKQSIIDLNITIQSLHRCFNFITNLINTNENLYFKYKKKRILFVCNNNKIKNLKPFLNHDYYYLLQKTWKTGYISKRLKTVDLIISLSPNDILEKESYLQGVPLISLVDTDSRNLNIIRYPIVTNTSSIQSIFLIIFLFQRFFDNLIINK